MMITKDDDKGDEKKLNDQSKNNSSKSIRIQDSRRKFRVKNQDSRFKISRIKDQDSRIKIQEIKRSRFKTQDSRFKNQEKA